MSGLGALLLANIPLLLLMLVGVVLLVVEMYIPGFGVPGLLGLASLLLSFYLLHPTVTQALVLLAILAAILCVALSVCLFTASKGRLSRSKLVLNDVAVRPDSAENNDLSFFLGKTGTAHTALRPAGIGDFDGVRLNVVSDGEFIPAGKAIRVESVSGNRIVVRAVDETGASAD